MAKNLIIFGAGASYGSNDLLNDKYSHWKHYTKKLRITPPLGKELLTKLTEFEPSLWNLVSHFFENQNFENGWKSLQNSLDDNGFELLPYLKSMARYFFHTFKTNPMNLYYHLSEAILNIQRHTSSVWDGAIATLNYDMLIFQSFSQVGVRYFLDYDQFSYTHDPNGRIEICVPHGCSCFFEDVSMVADPRLQEFRGSLRGFSVRTEMIGRYDEHLKNLQCTDSAPIMAYYTNNKNMHFGRQLIQQQKAAFKRLVSAASRIALVGIAFQENDDHIWKPLEETEADIYYFEPYDCLNFEQWNNRINKLNASRSIVLKKESFYTGFNQLCEILEIP